MIPAVGASGYLPPGVHPADWAELTSRYDVTQRRHKLCRGFQLALAEFRAAGCPQVYIGGSFLTPKPDPNDIDCCFDYAHHLDWPHLFAVELLSTADDCAAQRARYGCEFHLANMAIDMFGPIRQSITFLEFYQRNADGESIGVVALDVRSLP